jgi:hypothetical protein
LNAEQRALAKRLCVIASAAKQSSAREARQLKKHSGRSKLSALFARLPARGWIASAFALRATADKSLRLAPA